MSKFVEKLKQNSQITPPPMGFNTIQTKQKPRMLIIIVVPVVNDNLPNSVAAADAALLKIEDMAPALQSLQKAKEAVPGLPWGAWLNAKIKGVSGAEDFAVFPLEAPFRSLHDKAGLVLEVEMSLSDSMLRALEELSADAILLKYEINELTWQDMVNVQRVANLSSKPLLIPATPNITDDELLALWRAGISAIIIDAAGAPSGLKDLRERVEKLSFPLPRKPKKMDVMLPFMKGESEESEEPEEPDEDE